jgi:AraC family transcriptional regulator, transcriptional activator of pobA
MNEQPLPVKDKIQEKTIKIAPFRKDIRKTVAHRHNSYFELIYLSQGTGYHTIDSVQYAIVPPIAFFIRQEQTHHWELESEPEGYVIILKKKFLEDCLDKQLHRLLIQVSNTTCTRVSDPRTVEILFGLLLDEYKPETGEGGAVMEGLLKALLAKLADAPLPHESGKNQSTFQRYQELLSHSKTLKNSVAHYATLLHTTPQNLNTICRKAVGQTAAVVLSDFIVNEAKRLLSYTDLSVAEVAAILDFKDTSHFVKYFKRHTGQTPAAYRSLI